MSDNKIEFFAEEYKEENWFDFSRCFSNIVIEKNIKLQVPEDVMKSIIGLVGEESALNWIEVRLRQLEFTTAIDLAKSDKGLKALKAMIMRMPN